MPEINSLNMNALIPNPSVLPYDELPIEANRELDGFFSSSEDGPPKWLLMLRAYLDESGHETNGWTFIAGFLGNEEQWLQFEPKWKLALGPQRKSLHMNELRWNRDRTRQLLARLGPIPRECKLTPVLGGVRFEDYKDLVTGKPEEKIVKGYVTCLFALVSQVLRVVPANERLEIFFEAQREYESYTNLAFSTVLAVPDEPFKTTSDGKPKIARWGFMPKGSTILLDPADYLAFALREVWTNRTSKKTEWCESILGEKDSGGIGAIMDRDTIRGAVTNAQVGIAFTVIQRAIERQKQQQSKKQ